MRYTLKELIDVAKLQELTDALYEAAGIPSSIIDMTGEILTGSGWQRICTDFHRQHPEIEKACIDSDVLLRDGAADGEPFAIYECPMGLVDASAPIVIDGEHVASVFAGQVLTEPSNEATEKRFRDQARAFRLDEEEYVKAFREVRVFPPERFREALRFLVKLAELVANLGLLRKRELVAAEALRESEARLSAALRMTGAGHWEYDVATDTFTFNDHFYRILRTTAEEVGGYAMSSAEYARRFCHPDDMHRVRAVTEAAIETSDPGYSRDLEHRIVRADGSIGTITVRFFIVKDEHGRTVKTYGVNQDITERKRAEETLRESEGRLARILETVPDGITIVDAGGRITFANAAAERVLRLDRRDITAHTYNAPRWKIAAADGGAVADEDLPVARVLRTGMPVQDVVHAIEHPDGTRAVLSINAAPLHDALGGVSGVAASITDVTEQHRAARALADSERKFATLFAEASMPSALSRLPDYRVEDVNEAWLRLFGYSKDEVIGKTSLEIGVSRDPEARSRLMDEMQRHGHVRDLEQAAYAKTGEVLTVVSNINVITIGGQQYAITSVQDVTDRKRTDEALRQSEARFRAIAEQMSDMVFMTDARGKIAYVSPTSARLFRCEPAAMEGRHFGDFLLEQDVPKAMAAFRATVETGEPSTNMQLEMKRADGSTFFGEVTGSQFRHADGFAGSIGLIRDVTDRKKAEEAVRESNELLSAFIKHSPIYAFVKEVTPTESRVLTASENYQDMVGIPGSKMAGMTMAELFPPEFAATITADDQAVVAGGTVLTLDEELNDRHYTTIKFPIVVGGRNLLAGYTIDLTDRKRAENRLRESEAELRRLLEASDQSRLALLSLAEDQRIAESALRRSEEQLRQVGDNLPDSYLYQYTRDAGGTPRFLYVSSGVHRVHGLEPEEVLRDGDILNRQTAAEQLPALAEAEEASARGLTDLSAELRIRRADGAMRWLRVRSRPHRQADGLVAWDGVATDITERVEAESALRESESRYQTLAESSPVGIFRTDAGGATTYVNRRWCEIAGMTHAEALGAGWMKAVHPDDRGPLAAGWAAATRHAGESTAEYRLVRPDGERAWVLGRAVPEVDGSGQVVGYVGTITDITERQRAEETLRESEELQRAIIGCSPLAIFSLDMGGSVTTWNDAAERTFGWSAEETLGKPAPFVDHEHQEEFAALQQRVHKGSEIRGLELVRRRKDGTRIVVRLWAAPIRDARENVTGIMASIEDVTERKRADEALRRRASELATVHRVGQHLRTLLPPQELADLMIRALEELVGSDLGAVLLLDETDQLVPFALSDQGRGLEFARADREYVTDARIVKGRGITGWVAAEGVSARVDDVSRDERYLQLREGVRSELCVPLKVGEAVIGVVNVESMQPEAFSADDQRLLETVAGQFAVALQNTRLYEQVQRELRERLAAEGALRESEERFRSLFESMTELVAIHELVRDRDGRPVDYRILDCNSAFSRITGIAREAARGALASELYGVQEAPYLGLYAEVAETEKPAAFEAFFEPLGKHFFIHAVSPAPGQFATIASDITEHKDSEAERDRLLAQVRGLATRIVEVEESERKQIARELHDRVGQTLTALGLNLSMIGSSLSGSRAAAVQELLSDSMGLLSGATEQVRDVMADLRPPVLDDYGLVPALRWQLERFAVRTGIRTTMTGEDLVPRPPMNAETALFRTVQEGLTNVAKHARATFVAVTVQQEAGSLRIEVVDDGVGFDADGGVQQRRAGGWGLIGMRERVEAIGGTVAVTSAPGKGTRVIIEMRTGNEDQRPDRRRPRRRS